MAKAESDARRDLVLLCFEVLEEKLHVASRHRSIREALERKQRAGSLPLPTKSALFVTWKKGAHCRLRGCIGTFAQQPLLSGVEDYALTSALHDSRFSPITEGELSDLFCTVSLLSDFEPTSIFGWDVGVHGVRIHFDVKGKRFDACYLPEVAEEMGWDQDETLRHLVQKAGYNGSYNDDVRSTIHVERFQSVKTTLSHADYRAALR